MIVVDAPTTPWVPVLGDRQEDLRIASGYRIVQVSAIRPSVRGFRSVDEPLRSLWDKHLKDRPGRHCGPILIEDGPSLGPRLEPHADVVAVGSASGAHPIRGRRDEDDGVWVAVDARVTQVSVSTAAVLLRSGVDERNLAGGFISAPPGLASSVSCVVSGPVSSTVFGSAALPATPDTAVP